MRSGSRSGELTAGRLRYVTIPFFVIFVAVPALAIFVRSYVDLAKSLGDWLSRPTSRPTKAEKDVLDEWVLVIESADSARDGRESLDRFAASYERSGQSEWRDDILLVRDPVERGKWLVVVDLVGGKGSRAEVSREYDVMLKWLDVQGGTIFTDLGRWLHDCHPLLYDRELFQETYGVIEHER